MTDTLHMRRQPYSIPRPRPTTTCGGARQAMKMTTQTWSDLWFFSGIFTFPAPPMIYRKSYERLIYDRGRSQRVEFFGRVVCCLLPVAFAADGFVKFVGQELLLLLPGEKISAKRWLLKITATFQSHSQSQEMSASPSSCEYRRRLIATTAHRQSHLTKTFKILPFL